MLKILIVFLFSIKSVYAVTAYKFGTFVPYVGKMQVSDSGSTQTFDFNPYIAVGKPIKLKGNHYFLPEFGYTFFTSTAKKTNKSIITFKYNLGYTIKKFILTYGLSTHWYRLSGEGGTVTLNNGSGMADFKSPSTTMTTYYTTLDLGTEYFFNKKIGVRFDLNTMSFTNSESMAFNYLLSFNYYR